MIQQCAEAPKYSPCIFEFVYFARPDSVIDDISVYKTRLRMGERLAAKIHKEWHDEKIDVVIPIPDTSRVSALQLANELDVKYSKGFWFLHETNRMVEVLKTFIRNTNLSDVFRKIEHLIVLIHFHGLLD